VLFGRARVFDIHSSVELIDRQQYAPLQIVVGPRHAFFQRNRLF
jgi:hypothetical protein